MPRVEQYLAKRTKSSFFSVRNMFENYNKHKKLKWKSALLGTKKKM